MFTRLCCWPPSRAEMTPARLVAGQPRVPAASALVGYLVSSSAGRQQRASRQSSSPTSISSVVIATAPALLSTSVASPDATTALASAPPSLSTLELPLLSEHEAVVPVDVTVVPSTVQVAVASADAAAGAARANALTPLMSTARILRMDTSIVSSSVNSAQAQQMTLGGPSASLCPCGGGECYRCDARRGRLARSLSI
jgi:hypothetical protein